MSQVPTQVSFRNMSQPLGLVEQVHEKVPDLEKIYPRLTACRVMIECRNHRHPMGDLFHVRIDVTVPGAELVVSRDPSEQGAYQDLKVIVHTAFDQIRRQLENHVSRLRTGTH